MSYNSKYSGKQVEDLLGKAETALQSVVTEDEVKELESKVAGLQYLTPKVNMSPSLKWEDGYINTSGLIEGTDNSHVYIDIPKGAETMITNARSLSLLRCVWLNGDTILSTFTNNNQSYTKIRIPSNADRVGISNFNKTNPLDTVFVIFNPATLDDIIDGKTVASCTYNVEDGIKPSYTSAGGYRTYRYNIGDYTGLFFTGCIFTAPSGANALGRLTFYDSSDIKIQEIEYLDSLEGGVPLPDGCSYCTLYCYYTSDIGWCFLAHKAEYGIENAISKGFVRIDKLEKSCEQLSNGSRILDDGAFVNFADKEVGRNMTGEPYDLGTAGTIYAEGLSNLIVKDGGYIGGDDLENSFYLTLRMKKSCKYIAATIIGTSKLDSSHDGVLIISDENSRDGVTKAFHQRIVHILLPNLNVNSTLSVQLGDKDAASQGKYRWNYEYEDETIEEIYSNLATRDVRGVKLLWEMFVDGEMLYIYLDNKLVKVYRNISSNSPNVANFAFEDLIPNANIGEVENCKVVDFAIGRKLQTYHNYTGLYNAIKLVAEAGGVTRSELAEVEEKLSELGSEVGACVKKEDGKTLINKTFNDKLEGLDLDVEKINIIYNRAISKIQMPGFSIENVDEGIRIRKKSGDGNDNPDWSFISFELDEGYVWEKDHKYYLAVDMLITEDSQISTGCNIAAKYSNSATLGETYTAKHGVLGERHLYKLKLPINKDIAAEYPNSRNLFFQFGKYGKDDVFEGIIYNIYIADVGVEGADVNELWDNFDRFITENGLLSFKTTTNKELAKVVAGLDIQEETAYPNIISKLAIDTNRAYGSGIKYSIGQNNVLFQASKDIGVGKEDGDYYFVNFLLDDGIYWKKNHHYYCAIDMRAVCSDSEDVHLGITPKFDNSHGVGIETKKSTPNKGERGLYKVLINVNREENIDLYPKSRKLFIQFWNKIYSSQEFEVNIYNITLIDLGNPNSTDYIEWEKVDKIVQEGTLNEYSVSIARYAKNIKNNNIECWGDSLTAQNYGKYIKGEVIKTYGYGGKTSTYIRDEFFKNHNPNRTQVIWVGRNNYTETDVVIDDIRDMVSAIEHNDFIIMCPPNGYYGEFGTNGEDGTGEMKGGNGYSKFLELEKRLSEEYPSNFLNIRKAIIEGWRMGNVKLLSDFTQPSIGENVTIEVSDANFLTTYNSYDETKFGHDFVAKIRIGINGSYDVYKVIEKVDDTHLTIQLEEVKRVAAGSTVGNIIDTGGTNAIKYLRVVQNADYMCWLYDTTLSTFRKDGIHMTEDGLKLVAQIVSRKLSSMKLL